MLPYKKYLVNIERKERDTYGKENVRKIVVTYIRYKYIAHRVRNPSNK